MPPITLATLSPLRNSPPGASSRRSSILKTSGPPGVYITAAFMVPMETLEDWSAFGLLALCVGRGKTVAGNFEFAAPVFAENEKLQFASALVAPVA
jgi:hypothetical protein